MAPAHDGFGLSRRIVQEAIEDADVHAIDWQPDQILILDNWRVLHARGSADSDDADTRVLERVLVEAGR